MRRLLAAFALVAASSLCAACADSGVDKLGQKIVAELKADPLVADVRYSYWHPGLDDSQNPRLTLTVAAAAEHVELPAFQPLIRRTTEEVWQSKTDLTQLYYVITARGYTQPTPTDWSHNVAAPADKFLQICVRLDGDKPDRTPLAEPSSSPTARDEPDERRRLIEINTVNDCARTGDAARQQYAEALADDMRAAYGPQQSR